MASLRFLSLFLVLPIHIALFSSLCFAEDDTIFYDFKVSYITASPLGVPQQVHLFLSGLLLFGLKSCKNSGFSFC